MISDPQFYMVAIPAVVIYGLAKGGLGGAISQLCVPLMALVISPLTAAAILLPVLVLMDAVAVYSYRGVFDRQTLVAMLPGGLVGIGMGWLAAAWVTPDQVRLIVGIIGLTFTLDYFLKGASRAPARPHSRLRGGFWGMVAGFTSFVSHSGSPPFHMYALPLRLQPRVLAGTSALFFATMNVLKLFPYLQLGQYSRETLMTSLVLLPVAPLITRLGVYLVRVIDPRLFYRVAYAGIFLASLKLTWDGAASFL